MKPIKVEFQAFGPYAGHEIVDFEAISGNGLFLICGKTGIGKTMILDAMTFALYGKSSGHGRDDFEAMRCTNAAFETATFVRFTFENQGEYYLFERRLERKRKNLAPAYGVMRRSADGVWQPLFENAKEKALNEKAVEIIGLDFEQFRQVIVLPQGQFEKLLTSNSDEKEKILTSIFGEDKWQKIAEALCADAAERKEQLKKKKDRIAASLQEEQCQTLGQLQTVISQNEEARRTLEEEYLSADYDAQTRQQQEMLVLTNRFGDLHKAKRRVEGLSDRKSERISWERRQSDAIRAERVRSLLETADTAKAQLTGRQQEEATVRLHAQKAQQRAQRVQEELEAQLAGQGEAEEKKARRIQYEGKRTAYQETETLSAQLRQTASKEKAAMQEEKAAQETYEAFTAAIVRLQQEYAALNEEHSHLLEKYLAGITGELAGQLTEGAPCPVCGSTVHPHKAKQADNHITKVMVDAKKAALDKKYKELQTALGSQEQAKKKYEDGHAASEALHAQSVSLQGSLEAIKRNLVPDIASLEKLEDTIVQLGADISAYEAKKAELEQAQKTAAEAYTQASARIEPTAQECRRAEAEYESAMQAVEQGLAANGFTTLDEARGLLLSEEALEMLRRQMSDYDAAVKAAAESLRDIGSELADKQEPDEAQCRLRLQELTDKKTEYAKNKAVLDARIARLQEKAAYLEAEGEGIEAQLQEAEEDFAFAKKLRGDSGTGLQRYVLGIMFSSVVAAANRMLELVHGGRYRLYRSDEKAQGTNKRGLELKVFDMHSEEHEGRFVSTLSGGEKFLASLALSIGMSTVAQKSGIRIEALFIDEGFGSLDEASIDDAMNILEGIQRANGMVGIISHVQLLQDRIPTKLRVEEAENGSHIVQTIG